MVGHGGGRDQVSASIAFQRLRQPGVQGTPLAEGDQLVRHITRQHLSPVQPLLRGEQSHGALPQRRAKDVTASDSMHGVHGMASLITHSRAAEEDHRLAFYQWQQQRDVCAGNSHGSSGL